MPRHPDPGSAPPRSREAIVSALAAHLVERPDATLAQLAQRVGVGRTTLHRLFPTREAVLRAVALDAIERVRGTLTEADLPVAFVPGTSPQDSWRRVEAAVERLVPLGPHLAFLLRTRELDGDPLVGAGAADLDAPLEAALARAQALGEVDATITAVWGVASLYALVYVAWEQVAGGHLAPRHAAPLVMRTWRNGVVPRA